MYVPPGSMWAMVPLPHLTYVRTARLDMGYDTATDNSARSALHRRWKRHRGRSPERDTTRLRAVGERCAPPPPRTTSTPTTTRANTNTKPTLNPKQTIRLLGIVGLLLTAIPIPPHPPLAPPLHHHHHPAITTTSSCHYHYHYYYMLCRGPVRAVPGHRGQRLLALRQLLAHILYAYVYIRDREKGGREREIAVCLSSGHVCMYACAI